MTVMALSNSLLFYLSVAAICPIAAFSHYAQYDGALVVPYSISPAIVGAMWRSSQRSGKSGWSRLAKASSLSIHAGGIVQLYCCNRVNNHKESNGLPWRISISLMLLLALPVGATPIKVGVVGEPNYSHSGLYIAQATAAYQQQDLAVNIISFANQQALKDALFNNQIDVGLANVMTLAYAMESNTAVTLLAVIEQMDDSAFVSSNSSNIAQEIAQGVVYGNLNDYLSAQIILQSLGLADHAVFTQSNGELIYPRTLNSYTSLLIDLSTSGLHLDQYATRYWQLSSKDIGQTIYGDALIAAPNFTNAELIERFLTTTLAAWQLAYNDPQYSANKMASHTRQDASKLLEQANAMRAHVLPDLISIGQVDPLLLHRQLGQVVELPEADISDFIYEVDIDAMHPQEVKQSTNLLALVVIGLGVMGLFLWHVQRSAKSLHQQKRVIDDLRKDQRNFHRLQSVVKASYFGCAHLSISENRIFFDPQAREVLSLQPSLSESSLDNFFDYLNPVNQDRVRRLFWNGVASNQAFTLIFDENFDGGIRRIHARFVPTSVRQQLEYCMLVRDDSEQLRLDNDMRQLRMTLDQARRANETIRSQLSRSIGGHIEIMHQQMMLLMQDQQDPHLEETIARAMISMDQVKSILRDINHDGTREAKTHARLDLSTVLRTLHQRAIEMAQPRGIEVTLVEPREPYILLADALRVRQLIANILDNAIKYTVHGRVTLQANGQSDNGGLSWHTITIVIKDTGIGLSQEQLRTYQSTKLDHSSAISGIAYLKRLGDQCGASLTASSVEGQGSTVTITLKAPTLIDDQPPKLGHFQTLIIDLDRPYRRRLIDQLEMFGSQITTASSIRDAIDEIQVSKPSLVLLAALNATDAKHQLARIQAQQQDNLPPIAVILDESTGDYQRLTEQGAHAVLRSPIAINNLAALLEQVIGEEAGNPDSGSS